MKEKWKGWEAVSNEIKKKKKKTEITKEEIREEGFFFFLRTGRKENVEDTQEVSFRNGVDREAVEVGAVVPFASRLTRVGRGVKTSNKEL